VAKSPYATDKDDKILYVKAKFSGIHWLVLIADGMPLSYFRKGVTPYLTVVQAIAWHKKELRDSKGASGNRRVLDALESALKKFESGNITT